MLNNLGMSHFLTLTSPTFIRLTYEFLSYFRYTTPIGGSRTTGIIHFRMFNRTYAINQDQLADLLSFPHGYDFACQHPLDRDWESRALDFWEQLTGKTTTDWEGLKSTAIQNPTIRYLHLILASTIFGQENTGNVNSRDVFLIYCALSRTKVNPTPFLLAHFQSTYVQTGGHICVVGLITSMALALNLGTKLATLEPLETLFVDLDYCRRMHLIKNKPDGKYLLMISNREVRGVTLPYTARINV